MGFEQGHGLGVFKGLGAEGLGDGVGGDVVVGRANPAGGKDVVNLRGQGLYRVDNGLLNVGNDTGLDHLNADFTQPTGEEGQVGVLCPTAENFVADDD